GSGPGTARSNKTGRPDGHDDEHEAKALRRAHAGRSRQAAGAPEKGHSQDVPGRRPAAVTDRRGDDSRYARESSRLSSRIRASATRFDAYARELGTGTRQAERPGRSTDPHGSQVSGYIEAASGVG